MNEPRCIYCGSHLNIDDPHAMGCPLSPAIRYQMLDEDDEPEPFGVPGVLAWVFMLAIFAAILIGSWIQIREVWGL